MKTISDLALFVKRHKGLAIQFDDDEFIVGTPTTVARSKYLDTALENLLEEYRRKNSGLVLRETATSTPGVIVAACGTYTELGGTCPQCNNLPRVAWYDKLTCSKCDNEWVNSRFGTYAFMEYGTTFVRYKRDVVKGWEKLP